MRSSRTDSVGNVDVDMSAIVSAADSAAQPDGLGEDIGHLLRKRSADGWCVSDRRIVVEEAGQTAALRWGHRKSLGRWDNEDMIAATLLEPAAIARACERYGVARLRVFGSALTDRFDPDRSDVDFLVDFRPETHDLLGAYLGLKNELERITGRKADLVMSDAVENPYFAAEAFRAAQDVYAA